MSIDWHTDPEIVVRPQLAIAIYENQRGEVCIAQEGQYGEDEVYITVAKANAQAVAKRILDLAGIEFAALPVTPNASQDTGSAERQRRYRQRHRHTVTPTVTSPVTPDRNAHNAETVTPLLMAAE